MQVTEITLDPQDPEFRNDRYPTYKRMRDEAPAYRAELGGMECCVLTRYEDVDQIMRDDRRAGVRPPDGQIPARLGDGPAADFYRYSLPCVDPPDHTRLRKLISPALAPKVVEQMRGWIGELVDARLDELAGAGEIDFVQDFALIVPAQIACRVIHAPLEDAFLLTERQPALNPVLSQGELTPEALAAADESSRFYYEYLGELIDGLRGKLPEDDAIGALLAAEEDGERLSRIELLVSIVDLLIGSYHTTMTSLTAAVHALLRNPDQLALLREDPGLAAGAWEETLRWDGPIHFIWRDLLEPTEFHGERFEAGTHIVLGLAAANRDERQWQDPDRFDIHRRAKRHMSFAAGAHYCVGAPLSRLEGQVFLPKFFARFPEVELVEDAELTLFPDLSFAHHENLPLRLGRAV